MGKKLTADGFVIRSKEIHGGAKYDYTECVYVNWDLKVKLRCIEHDHKFEISPRSHIYQRSGCTKCSGSYSPTTDEFIAKSKEIHGELKYDYSECVYVAVHRKVKLRCIEHDHKFEVSPDRHVHQKTGCTKCTSRYIPTTTEFITKSKEIHGELKYDYSDCVYVNWDLKVKLRCIEHDHKFEVSPANHIQHSTGCTKCSRSYSPTTDEFIAKSKEIHGELKYDYSECVYVAAHRKVKLRCIEHNHKFVVAPSDHIHMGVGCFMCTTSNYSKAQIQWLDYISHQNNTSIQHAANAGEFKISGVGRVDGYCRETNTAYEFHGTFWHGHPSKYKADDIHTLNYKTYGELYQKTLERDQKIRDLGYNLVVIWEHEWRAIKKKLC